MGAVHDEYLRYMQWLGATEERADAKRIAQIVQDNLDALIPTVNNGGQRATVLTPMLRRDLDNTPDVIEPAQADAAAAQLPWTRLKKLMIGPFRGFRREEEFDLSYKIVLFQGPNGSGKSSLCEALEFALLGYVEEASAKRIEDLGQYFNNIHEGRYVAPQLLAAGGDNGVPVAPNAELLRFAIVEKNRIEGFARLAARTPAQAGALIATLFGLEGFNAFVGNFTANLDNQLRLGTPKQDTLALRRTALGAARKKVDGNAEAQAAFDAEQTQLANGFEEGLTYELLLRRLGMDGQEGRLQEVNAALQEQIPAQLGLTVASFAALRKSILKKLAEVARTQADLDARAGEVSFLALYRAVKTLAEETADKCPACDTPLANVARNPFVRAHDGLELLADLAALEASRGRLRQECNQLSFQLHGKVAAAHAYAPLGGGDIEPLVQWVEQDQPIEVWSDGLLTKATWKALLAKVRALEEGDADIRARQAQRAPLREEQRDLQEVKDQVDALRLRRSMHDQQVMDEQAKINGFDEAEAALIAEADAEAATVAFEKRMQSGYASFLDSLKRYRDGLPEGLLAGLNETAQDLYNLFNVDDHDHDKLAKLDLPLHGGERIRIAFAGSPGQLHDALRVLSEGHLRCLGLAILLAKNIKLGLPLLVFDDAVNAIDHDHRKGIRDALFGDARLNGKQIVITCHSPEFITQVQNGLGQGVSKLYILKHHVGDHQPIVKNGSDRHYLRRAQERLDEADQRQALASCRQALENLTTRVWKALGNADDSLGRVSLVLRRPDGDPELRNLVEVLSKAVNTGVDQGRLVTAAWAQRKEAFQELLTVPDAALAWKYLNKGTHDGDGEDFEIGIVQQILAALTKLSNSFGN
ncbi:ATP-binding protein [Stenotrophomonas maltophilia]|uniref:ATP-binding protein n=1 Tax=Stenotrophomonas maltophilia TaxID=40324 RepID=UPI00140487CA|nr:AAA family ATPase [Stenotrophomonas maltophilia]